MSEEEALQEEEETELDWEDLKGVGRVTAGRLRDAGFYSVEELAITPLQELMDKAGLDKRSAEKLAEAARQRMNMSFISARDLWEKRKGMMRCSTGSQELDDLLAGGIETQAMTELVGQYGAGKTQICLKLCVMAQLPPEKGGLGGNALFFDTEGTFSAQRIHQIAEAMELDPEPILDGVLVSRVYTSEHQILLLDHCFKMCKEEGVRLVIVDSLISHFRSEYIGRENLAQRQQKLNNYLHKLLRLAELYNLAVVVTNQAQANPNAFFGSPNRPAGGHVMAHACTHRIMLRKSKGPKRIAKVFDSPYIPEHECRFTISDKGIEDA